MKGYSTKYALSKGIQSVEVRPPRQAGAKYVYTTDQDMTQLVPGQTFFVSRDEAEHEARCQAEAKIFSLKKQIEKLEALVVTPRFAKVPP